MSVCIDTQLRIVIIHFFLFAFLRTKNQYFSIFVVQYLSYLHWYGTFTLCIFRLSIQLNAFAFKWRNQIDLVFYFFFYFPTTIYEIMRVTKLLMTPEFNGPSNVQPSLCTERVCYCVYVLFHCGQMCRVFTSEHTIIPLNEFSLL